MKPNAFPSLILAAALAAAAPALAHDDAYLDTVKAPHGGQLRMAGPYHFELVAATPLAVYVTDHAGAKVSTKGATGRAIVLAGKEKATLVLEPYGENALKAAGAYPAQAGMKVVVTVTLPGESAPQQARFTPAPVR